MRPGEVGDPNMTNREFLDRFLEKITGPGLDVRPSTAQNYRGYVSRMIDVETRRDPGFRATNWLALVGSAEFRALRGAHHYVLDSYGDPSAKA